MELFSCPLNLTSHCCRHLIGSYCILLTCGISHRMLDTVNAIRMSAIVTIFATFLSLIHCIPTAHFVECFHISLMYCTAICLSYLHQLGKHSESVLDNCQYQNSRVLKDSRLRSKL